MCCKSKLVFNKRNTEEQSATQVDLPAILPDVVTPPLTPARMVTEDVEQRIDESFYSAESSDEDDHRWDESKEENAQMRRAARKKQESLARTYGSHIDHSPLIVESKALLPKAIQKLSPVDRITIRMYIGNLKEKEKQAIELAQIYRHRTEELKQTCLELQSSAHKEREGVRYFWRQQILEGSTRSGRMVREAITKKQK